MNKKLLLCLVGFITIITACRKTNSIPPDDSSIGTVTLFSVANVLQSNMVVQRDKPLVIWGHASTTHIINVTTSWDTASFSAIADHNGFWKVTIPAAAANNTAQTITCNDGADAVTFKNVLLGDVWVCSGQSNMTMPVDVIAPFTGVLNYQQEISSANYPDIRALTITESSQTKPLDDFANPQKWITCSPETVGNFSAVAYFFARKLHTSLHVPIGIIIASVNGSWCESWMNQQAFQDNAGVKRYAQGNNASHLYNGMISPLINLQIKGFTWYQGENNQNISPVSDYTQLNSALIQGWRTVFNQGVLPFYYVQLTPFAEDYNNTNPVGGDPTANWLAYFREAQSAVLAVSATGMAITMDVGEAANHHPRNKKPVGERLALLALNNTYSQNATCYDPRYLNFTTSGSTATINFTNSNGLNTISNQPLNQLFFVAGADHTFKQGTAQISGNNIIVTAPVGFSLPIQAIRYAFTNAAITNLQNDAGLPMEPFRTDNWGK